MGKEENKLQQMKYQEALSAAHSLNGEQLKELVLELHDLHRKKFGRNNSKENIAIESM